MRPGRNDKKQQSLLTDYAPNKFAAFYNIFFRHAWLDFDQREQEELLNPGPNCTTSYYRNTGLFPFNENPELWCNVLRTLSLNNERVDTGGEKKSRRYKLQVKDKDAARLTNNNNKLLLTGILTSTNATKTAYSITCRMLARYREEMPSDPTLGLDVPTLTPLPPLPLLN